MLWLCNAPLSPAHKGGRLIFPVLVKLRGVTAPLCPALSPTQALLLANSISPYPLTPSPRKEGKGNHAKLREFINSPTVAQAGGKGAMPHTRQ